MTSEIWRYRKYESNHQSSENIEEEISINPSAKAGGVSAKH